MSQQKQHYKYTTYSRLYNIVINTSFYILLLLINVVISPNREKSETILYKTV